MAKGAGEPAEEVVKDIRRKTRRRFSAEEKIRRIPAEPASPARPTWELGPGGASMPFGEAALDAPARPAWVAVPDGSRR